MTSPILPRILSHTLFYTLDAYVLSNSVLGHKRFQIGGPKLKLL
jgi:hypothetical protein